MKILGFVKDSINEVLNASIGVKIIVDTEVEKIEEKPDNDSVNQKDVGLIISRKGYNVMFGT
ncbi:MAG: hypothetical protein CM1200mP31_5500 [Candidatus Neomarinimicrobiota bacterium]|nr:MAG: hypothetical protein CM1200mP31_5500 [Candidatus Neomarinimicrobiota bacterium]